MIDSNHAYLFINTFLFNIHKLLFSKYTISNELQQTNLKKNEIIKHPNITCRCAIENHTNRKFSRLIKYNAKIDRAPNGMPYFYLICA